MSGMINCRSRNGESATDPPASQQDRAIGEQSGSVPRLALREGAIDCRKSGRTRIVEFGTSAGKVIHARNQDPSFRQQRGCIPTGRNRHAGGSGEGSIRRVVYFGSTDGVAPNVENGQNVAVRQQAG